MSWLDDLIGSQVAKDGTLVLPRRGTINVQGAHAADNASTEQTDVDLRGWGASGPVIWVDSSAQASGTGTYLAPYNDLSTAVAALPATGGTLILAPGVYAEDTTITLPAGGNTAVVAATPGPGGAAGDVFARSVGPSVAIAGEGGLTSFSFAPNAEYSVYFRGLSFGGVNVDRTGGAAVVTLDGCYAQLVTDAGSTGANLGLLVLSETALVNDADPSVVLDTTADVWAVAMFGSTAWIEGQGVASLKARTSVVTWVGEGYAEAVFTAGTNFDLTASTDTATTCSVSADTSSRQASAGFVPYSASVIGTNHDFPSATYVDLWGVASAVHLNATGVTTITGMGEIPWPNGWAAEKRGYNTGTNSITFKHQDVGSGAARRIITPTAGDLVIAAGGAWVQRYDVTAARWYVYAL